jgi:hypothetical protein
MNIYSKSGFITLLVGASTLGAGCTSPDSKPGTAKVQKSPYQFLRSKSEGPSGRDVMELFAFSGKFNQKALVEFCQRKKKDNKAKGFYYAVIFDNAANARFPSSPFTAQFGADEDSLKHIRAIYEFNRVNGFSELSYYDSNMWEGRATRVKP